MIMKWPVRYASVYIIHMYPKGGGTYFHWGGGGGGKDKKGHCNVKKGTTVYMRIIITNALMKHYCRHKVSFCMLSVVFLAGGTESNISSHTKNKK